MNNKILILDDPERDLVHLDTAFMMLAGDESMIEVVRTPNELYDAMARKPWDMVVIDSVLQGARGPDVVRRLRRSHDSLLIVAVVGENSVAMGNEMIAAGANDFLVDCPNVDIRPQLPKLKHLIAQIAEIKQLRLACDSLAEEQRSRYKMVGNSSQIKNIIDKIERVARIPRPILITGPRGTGKELVARAIHLAAGGAERPMLVVNCAAFTDELLDSTLFGHEKGAFTGAVKRSLGKFERANGGTLFLDEVGNMSKNFQQKIMRVVEYGSFRRVGGTEEIRVNTRVIAATNADLDDMMKKGEFMRDLYDRLAFEVIDLPPLKQRKDDIPLLAQHFMERFMEEIPDFRGKSLSKKAMDLLMNYSYPGNIRELKHIIERAVYRDTTNEITPEDLDMSPNVTDIVSGDTFDEKVRAFELAMLRGALSRSSNNQAEAARGLGLSYHQFRYYINQKYKEEFAR